MSETTREQPEESPAEWLQRLGMDGREWAREFRKTAAGLGYSDMDEGWLIGWFANAIMAGYDEGHRRALAARAALEASGADHHDAGTGEP